MYFAHCFVTGCATRSTYVLVRLAALLAVSWHCIKLHKARISFALPMMRLPQLVYYGVRNSSPHSTHLLVRLILGFVSSLYCIKLRKACGLFAAGILIWPAASLAASGLQGISVSPAYQEIDLSQQQPQVQFELEISNDSTADRNFVLSTTDFGSLDEEGGVAFLGQSADTLSDGRYGLAKWMLLAQTQVEVPARQSAQVQVTVANEASLAPGGHYGAVLATALDNNGKPLNSGKVGVKQVLSSLILLTKAGGAAPSLKLISQISNGRVWSLPSQINYRFQNSGNVHVVPRGIVTITDPAGRVVERGSLNAESGIILPESFRQYSMPLTSLATAWLPGQYAITTAYRYDGTEVTKTLVTHSWYAGAVVVWLLGGLAATLLVIIVWRRRRA